MLNLFVGVVVSAMQSFTDVDKAATIAAVDEAREYIEAELRAPLRQPRP